MVRRRPKIPRTTTFRVPFELGSSDWDRIEQAYAQSFSAQLRDEVVNITKDFLYWSSAEQTPPLRDAQKRAKSLRKFTASLLKEVQRKSDVSPYTNELIAVCFRKFWRKKNKSIPVAEWDAIPSEVTKALSSFLRACDEALNQMKSLSPKTWMWEDGEAWNRWVVQLSRLAETNGLQQVPLAAPNWTLKRPPRSSDSSTNCRPASQKNTDDIASHSLRLLRRSSAHESIDRKTQSRKIQSVKCSTVAGLF